MWGLAKRVVEAGAFAFIQKPFERAAFAQTLRLSIQCNRTLRKVMQGKRRLAHLSELLQRAQSTSTSSQAFDRALRQMRHKVRDANNSIAH